MVSLLPKRKIDKPIFLSPDFFLKNLGVSFAGGVLLLIVLFYGGVVWYENRLALEIKNTELEMQNLQEERDMGLENQVRDFAGRIGDIRAILSHHIYASKLLPFIESIAHPKAQFTNFSFDTESGGVSLHVATQDYITFGQQVFALEQNPNIHNLQVSNVKPTKLGQIVFSVSFEVDTSLYQ